LFLNLESINSQNDSGITFSITKDMAMSSTLNISLVIPCFNEELVLPETSSRLIDLVESLKHRNVISAASGITFIDDGSVDSTWRIITELSVRHKCVSGIKLSRNVGHQRALLAGLLNAGGDVLISMDADLQDDLNVVEKMIQQYVNGSEVVYGVRCMRSSDTAFKRITARGFYKAMRFLGAEIIEDHADFRLMGRRSIEELRNFKEVNLFLRGIVPLIGYPSSIVYYDRSERFAGESKYPLKKMMALAFDGLTSLSSVPLRLITYSGLILFLVSVGLGVWAFIAAAIASKTIPGWASTVLPIYFIGGIQMLSIGIIGEYVSKIYNEVKQRPRFIISRTTGSLVIGNGIEATSPGSGSMERLD
jgi:glycosyltransferase involved in cell wall biosynthesis